MEAQMHRPHGAYEEFPQHTGAGHSVVEGEGEHHDHHHGKHSVLKKVKAKAKKIKESIKHLGHEHDERDHDDEEEEDEDEEMVQDPEVHGAPIYESSVIRGATLPHRDVGVGPKSGANLENPASKGDDRFESNVTEQYSIRRFGQGTQHSTDEQRHFAPASGTYAQRFSDRSDVHGLERTEREPGDRIGVPTGLEKDPQAPSDQEPSNYESKVTDPTGHRGQEASVDPLVRSLGKMIVEDETEPKSEQRSYTGTHDQFAPRPIPTKATEGQGIPETIPKEFEFSNPAEMPTDPIDGKPGQNSYTDKISSAASAIADKASAAKNVVASKLGYGGSTDQGTEERPRQTVEASTDSAKSHSPTDYAHKAAATVTGTLAPVYGKVAGVGSAVMSKVRGTEGTTTPPPHGTESSAESAQSGSQTGYVQKATAAVTETLAPVYGKVADVGNTVISKVQGSGTGQDQRTTTETASVHEGKGRGVSMKEYIVEKLRPGEEDKALSEVISDTLHKKTGETGEAKPMGKVTESEEVIKRLGATQENPREGLDAIAAGSESSGNSVVDRITNAVTSWIVKGGESQSSNGSPGTSFEYTEGSKKG